MDYERNTAAELSPDDAAQGLLQWSVDEESAREEEQVAMLLVE